MAKSVFTNQEVSEDNPYASLASGVGFSNPYAIDALGPAQRQEQYVAEHMQSFVEKTESEEGLTAKDLEMTARAFIDGLWLNKSEEVGSYMGAAMVKLFNPELAQGKSVSEIAAEMKTGLEAESARFAEESPILSTTANIAGGVLSPVSLGGGKIIGEAAKIRQSAQAAKTQADVARTLGTTQASPEAALLAQQLRAQQFAPKTVIGIPLPASVQAAAPKVAEVVSKAPTPVAAAGFGGAEGAVIGFEGETTEDKAINAAFTAGISATVPFVFAGVKKAYDFFTEPKMAQELGEGADFVNLMFTNHGMSQFYRSVISKAYGGRTLSEQQARKMAGRAVTPASAREAAAQTKAEAARKTQLAKESINRNTAEAIEESGLRIDEKIAELKRVSSESAGAKKAEVDSRIAELEEAKINAGAAKVLAVKEADEAVNASNAFFRGQALREAAPPGASVDEINALGAMDPQDANRALDSLWSQYGFKVANGKEYTISSEDAVKFIDSIKDNYSDLALIGSERGGIIRDITRYISEEIASKAPNGVIKGEDLLNLRSTIGRAINGLSDANVSTRKFSSEVQDYFHSILEKGLTKAEKEAFAADRYAWSIRSTVDDAIARASGGNARAGAFDASDYLDAVKGFSARFAARGQGRLQQEAQSVAQLSKQNKENIINLANKEADNIRKESIIERTKLRADLTRQKDLLAKQRDAEIAALRRQQSVVKATEEGRQALQSKIAEVKERYSVQLADLDNQIQRASNETEALKNMMPSNFKGSVFENLFNTALVGQAVLFATPAATESLKATIAYGGAGARLLATETAQRILARQSSGQARLRSLTERLGQRRDVTAVAEATKLGTPAAAAQTVQPKEVMFSEERKQLLRKLPISGRAALYRNLEAKGSLDRLKAEDPKLHAELKRAYNAGR